MTPRFVSLYTWDMKTNAPLFMAVTILSLAMACFPPLDMGLQQSRVVSDFFNALNKGEYEEAAELYGGSYEALISMNPDLDPNDHAALWKNACEVNGFQCLSVRQISFRRETKEGEYVFAVTFNAADGSLFVQQAEDGLSVSEFEYRVLEGADGVWRVMDLPPYVP